MSDLIIAQMIFPGNWFLFRWWNFQNQGRKFCSWSGVRGVIPWKVKKLCLDQMSNNITEWPSQSLSWVLHINPILRASVYEPPFFMVQKILGLIHLGARCKVCSPPTSFNTSYHSRYLYLKVCWKKMWSGCIYTIRVQIPTK